jgi:NADPH:quinone reductase-like Zn-dependent oxidoreductase
MKAIVYRRHGEPADVLALEDVANPPAPGSNEVAVRIVKRMVHPIDDLMIRGIVPMPIPPTGAIPGGDGVGVVEQVGTGVDPLTGIVPSARVALFHVHGTWAERVVAPAASIIPLPDDVSDAIACQIVINGITAVMLMRAALAADSRAGIASPILITAAGSSVGRNVIALARARGAKVVAVVRSDAGAAVLSHSFEGLSVVSTEREGWPAAVASAYGEAPCVAMDPVGGDMTPQFLQVLADRGTLLTYGGLDARPSMISTIAMTMHELTIKGVAAPTWLTSTSSEQRVTDVADLFKIAGQAPQSLAAYREFALADAVNALSATQATPRRGAMILASGR